MACVFRVFFFFSFFVLLFLFFFLGYKRGMSLGVVRGGGKAWCHLSQGSWASSWFLLPQKVLKVALSYKGKRKAVFAGFLVELQILEVLQLVGNQHKCFFFLLDSVICGRILRQFCQF